MSISEAFSLLYFNKILLHKKLWAIKPHHWPQIKFLSSRGQESWHLSQLIAATFQYWRDPPRTKSLLIVQSHRLQNENTYDTPPLICAASQVPLWGSGRSPGGGHGNPLHCSCLENTMDRGAWQATAHRVAQSGTRMKWLYTHAP